MGRRGTSREVGIPECVSWLTKAGEARSNVMTSLCDCGLLRSRMMQTTSDPSLVRRRILSMTSCSSLAIVPGRRSMRSSRRTGLAGKGRGRSGGRVLAGDPDLRCGRAAGRERIDGDKGRSRAVDGRHHRRRRDRLLVERGQTLLLQGGMDRPQGGKQTFVVFRFRRVANADHHAVGGKQPAAAAADNRLAGHLHVPRRMGLAGGIAAPLCRRDRGSDRAN